MKPYNDLQVIKRRMYSLRNGVIADALRNAGSLYRYIFGLNLIQLKELAKEMGFDSSMAALLRSDKLCRESQLLAPMVAPVEQMTVNDAVSWISDVDDTETIDVLCHSLLRRMPVAMEVIERAIMSDRDLTRYAALRLMFNLIGSNLQKAKLMAELEQSRNCRLTAPICRQLLEEVDFQQET